MATSLYALPRDANRVPLQGSIVAPLTTLATTYDATISASTEITLNAATTIIEVSAIDKTILMKWGTADVTTSNFDEVISLNTTRVFMVPSGITAVNFIEQSATAILCVCEK